MLLDWGQKGTDNVYGVWLHQNRIVLCHVLAMFFWALLQSYPGFTQYNCSTVQIKENSHSKSLCGACDGGVRLSEEKQGAVGALLSLTKTQASIQYNLAVEFKEWSSNRNLC